MKVQKQNTGLVSLADALDGFDKLFINTTEAQNQGVWAEPQLYLLPFCVPQHGAQERFRQIKISESVTINNELKHRSFRVNPDPELGLPGTFELEVMTGIYRLADAYLKQYGCVPEFIELGTFRSFLQSIGRPGTGKYIRMLKDGLRRLSATTCISEGFFYSKPRNLYVVESFTFISSLEVAGETDFSGSTIDRTRVKLHEFIRENLNSNFRTLIDFNYIRGLRTDIAKPLSLHIAYRIFKSASSEWVVDYDWLAERLAIKIYNDLKRAKDQLKPALIELKESGLIESWQWLENARIKFIAGQRLVEMHQQRVKAKDAWVAHEKEKSRIEKSIATSEPRTVREAARKEVFDPLAALCAEYAYKGWKAVSDKALIRGLTETILKAEAISRGHCIQQQLIDC